QSPACPSTSGPDWDCKTDNASADISYAVSFLRSAEYIPSCYLSYHIFPCEKTGFMQSNVSKKADISEMMSFVSTMLKQSQIIRRYMYRMHSNSEAHLSYSLQCTHLTDRFIGRCVSFRNGRSGHSPGAI